MSEVVISSQQMFDMLVRIDGKLTAMSATMETLDERVADHEARLRTIEQKEDLARRLAKVESSITELQRRVWALPSIASIAAIAAIVLTLIRTY